MESRDRTATTLSACGSEASPSSQVYGDPVDPEQAVLFNQWVHAEGFVAVQMLFYECRVAVTTSYYNLVVFQHWPYPLGHVGNETPSVESCELVYPIHRSSWGTSDS